MKSQLAVQMYTVRDFTKTAAEFADALDKIRDIGYTAVQLSAVGAMSGDTPEVNAEQARKLLDERGLKCIATHRSWESLSQNTQQEIDFHQTLGCDFTAIGSIPNGFSGVKAAGYWNFVNESAPTIAALKAAGIRFGYHNHAFEFERAGYENGVPTTNYDIFVEESGPDFLLEIDLYWVGHAGANPERLVERCRGKMPVIHMKDKEMIGNEPVMAPIGEGNMDWANLLPACAAAGVEWYAVEQDVCRRDPFDCLKSSFDYLSNFDLSK